MMMPPKVTTASAKAVKQSKSSGMNVPRRVETRRVSVKHENSRESNRPTAVSSKVSAPHGFFATNGDSRNATNSTEPMTMEDNVLSNNVHSKDELDKRQKNVGAKGVLESSRDYYATWSPLMDGIEVIPDMASKVSSRFPITNSADLRKVHDILGGRIDAHINYKLYGQTQSRRLPLFEELCSSTN